jgi:hypothetical protein
MVARDKMTCPLAALTAKSASSHSSEGTYAAKWSAPVSAGGKTDPCPHTRGRSITWDVWRTQRAFALQFGIPYEHLVGAFVSAALRPDQSVVRSAYEMFLQIAVGRRLVLRDRWERSCHCLERESKYQVARSRGAGRLPAE